MHDREFVTPDPAKRLNTDIVGFRDIDRELAEWWGVTDIQKETGFVETALWLSREIEQGHADQGDVDRYLKRFVDDAFSPAAKTQGA